MGGAAVNTLQAFTSIDGAGGVNTLNAVLNNSVSPLALTKIQVVNATNVAGGGITLNLLNAPDVTNVNNVASANALTVSNIASGANLSTRDVNVATTFSYVSTNTVAADLTVTGVTTAGTDITVDNSSGTVNLTSAGTAANSVELLDATTNITTVNVDGTANLTLVAADATTVNANQTGDVFSGNLTFTAGVAATVNGGSGNDVLTGAADVVGKISGNDGNDTITAGANTGAAAHADSLDGGLGNDVITNADLVANTSTAANNDTIVGGGGIDTLVSTTAALTAVDNTAANAVQSISGIEAITVSNALAGNLTLSKIQAGINTLNLAAGVTGARTITFDTAIANASVNLAGTIATNADTTVTAAGTATTDAVTINNTAAAATNVFNAGQLVASGYETLTLNGGTLVAAQTLDTLAINGSNGNAATVNLTGANAFTLSDVATNNTGVLTINASGLTLATGTVFTYADGTFATGATQSITGSEGNDSIVADNGKAATITGGAGIDTLTGGAAADSIQGGLGNDVIDGAAGNDVLKGNEGDDAITIGAGSDTVDGGAGNDTIVAANNLTAADSIDGGTGVNTLSITAAVTSPSIGGRVSNIQNLATSATSQDLSMFTATTLTAVTQSAAGNGTLALTNAGASLATLNILEGDALVTGFARDVDTTSNALTVNAGIAIAGGSALTASNEETITLAGSTFAVDLDLATATDLTTLIVTGSGNQIIDAQAATLLSSVNIAGVTGTATANIDASASTVALTFTGAASTGNQSITSGSGADVITAGAGKLIAIAGSGNDIVTGSTLADTITGGAGADSLTGGSGNDTFIVGSTLTDWAAGDSVAGGDGVADILQFGAAGVITYVDRTVTGVEVLTLTSGAGNRVTVYEGSGLTEVNNLDTALNTFTLNHSTTVFAAESADAASVNTAGEWFYDVVAGDGVLTYYDEVAATAVEVILIGTDAVATSDAAVVAGNVVITLA